MSDDAQLTDLCDHFRGFYPAMIDVETAGFSAKTDALLKTVIIILKTDEQGQPIPDTTLHLHVEPFVGANSQPETLALNGIDPNDPDRSAVSEYEVLHEIFRVVRKGVKVNGYNRAIMVAHNASLNHSFMIAAAECASLKHNLFHLFTTFNTTAPVGLALRQTVLSKACQIAGMDFSSTQAHSTSYDAGRIAVLFYEIVSRWKRLGDWPLSAAGGVQSSRCPITRNDSGICRYLQ